MSRKIVLDCDPGHDDAIAILLAAGHPDLELLGITTVAGNQTLDKTSFNARVVATVAGLQDVPVLAGCDRPLVRPLRTAAAYHGDSGLDGPEPVVPTVPLAGGHAVDFLIESVLSSPGEVTVVAVGPLTNLALALRREPAIAEAAREVVIMGGAYGKGNTTQVAEFNIVVDPEAASIVFGAPWPVTMIGLDLTHQATCGQHVQDEIAKLGTAAGDFTASLLTFFRAAYQRAAGFPDPPVHDPCAVAFVLAPELFESRPARIEVELQGRLTYGATMTDFAVDAASARHQVPVRVDRDGFWRLVVDALARLG